MIFNKKFIMSYLKASGMTPKKINWRINAKMTSHVRTTAKGPACSHLRAIVKLICPMNETAARKIARSK